MHEQHWGSASHETRLCTPIGRDPLVEAGEFLHEAVRLPYSSSSANEWRRRFQQRVGAAREALWRHVARSAGEENERRQLHRLLVTRADALFAAAVAEEPVDIWRMVDLGERAARLERALRHHHRRIRQRRARG